MSKDNQIDEIMEIIRRETEVDNFHGRVTGGYQPIRSHDRGYKPAKKSRPPANDKPSPPKQD